MVPSSAVSMLIEVFVEFAVVTEMSHMRIRLDRCITGISSSIGFSNSSNDDDYDCSSDDDNAS